MRVSSTARLCNILHDRRAVGSTWDNQKLFGSSVSKYVLPYFGKKKKSGNVCSDTLSSLPLPLSFMRASQMQFGKFNP